MYNFFKNFHSGFRYIVFILIVIAIIQSIVGWLGKKTYTEGNRKMNLFAMISAHTQLLIGIVLYFLSMNAPTGFVKWTAGTMKDSALRYFAVEHWVGMVIAIALITIGHARSKRATTGEAKHKQIAIFYTIAVLVVIGTLISGHVPVLGS